MRRPVARLRERPCPGEPKSLHSGMQVLHRVNGPRGARSRSIAMGSNHDNSSQALSKMWLGLAMRPGVAFGMQKFCRAG